MRAGGRLVLASETGAEWETIARTSLSAMIRRLEEKAEALESTQTARILSGDEYFRLLVDFGRLRVDSLWNSLPIEEQEAIDSRTKEIQDRFSGLVLRRRIPSGRVSKGLLSAVKRVTRSLAHAEKLVRRNRKPYLSADLFDHDVLHARDELEYASAGMQVLGIGVEGVTSEFASELDQKMRRVLPKIASRFAESGEPLPAVYYEAFPKGFWWRHLAHAPIADP